MSFQEGQLSKPQCGQSVDYGSWAKERPDAQGDTNASQMLSAQWKQPDPNSYARCHSIYFTFWQRPSSKDREETSVATEDSERAFGGLGGRFTS